MAPQRLLLRLADLYQPLLSAYGIKWGYKGFYTNVKENWIKMRPHMVSDIHKLGGTILGSSRGGYDGDKIMDSLIE